MSSGGKKYNDLLRNNFLENSLLQKKRLEVYMAHSLNSNNSSA
jgi:hypothetical protein